MRMLAITDESNLKLDLKNCREELVEVFKIVADKIQAGNVPGYSIYEEKASGSKILYKNEGRNSMSPIAAMAGDIVTPLPPSLEPKSPEAVIRLMDLGVTLRQINAAFTPA